MRGNVAARELRFNPLEELGVDRHHVFVMAVNRAILDHPDLAIALDDLRFDFADLFVHQVAPIFLAVDNGFTRFLDAIWTKRVRLPRPAERRLSLLPRLQERFVRPLRNERRIRVVLVEELNRVEGGACCFADSPIYRPQNLRAHAIRHKPLSSLSKVPLNLALEIFEPNQSLETSPNDCPRAQC